MPDAVVVTEPLAMLDAATDVRDLDMMDVTGINVADVVVTVTLLNRLEGELLVAGVKDDAALDADVVLDVPDDGRLDDVKLLDVSDNALPELVLLDVLALDN
eukprot:2345313-Amphidinium_carterae.1